MYFLLYEMRENVSQPRLPNYATTQAMHWDGIKTPDLGKCNSSFAYKQRIIYIVAWLQQGSIARLVE
jgi:hypothetical protein